MLPEARRVEKNDGEWGFSRGSKTKKTENQKRNKEGMKNIMNPTRNVTNKRGFTAKWASAIVCFALMLVGMSAFGQANNNFANAIVIPASIPATVNGDNTGATSETGEPLHSDWPDEPKIGRNSIWWNWTPTDSGPVAIDTIGSTIDTGLGVWTGTAVNSLNLVARNEDGSANGVPLQGGRSRVTFDATAGTTYRIAVVGFENIAGPVTVNISSGGGTTNPPPTGLALTVTTTGSGTVTKDPSKSSYETNDVVTLTATPAGTNTFLGWGGDIGTNSATANPITITMDANKTISAAFTSDGGGGGNCGDLTSITVSTNGNGRVTPNLNGKDTLVVCRTYRLTAVPARDWIFAGWTGVSSNANNPRLVFEMQPGMNITANFVPNPFLPVSGVFNGLFFESTNVSTACSGGFTVRVQKSGRYTATFIKGGKRVVANGTFDSTGNASGTAGRGTNAVTFNMQLLGLNGGDADKIAGTVTTSEGCTAQLAGDREVFNAQNPAPLLGNYTLILPLGVSESQTNVTTNLVVVTNNPGTTNEIVVTNEVVETNIVDTVANPGHSFATIAINKQGKARIAGELADGTRISQSTAVSKEGQIPLYVSLYRGTGLLLGWLNVTASNVSGIVNWERPSGIAFPNGIDADIEVIGSPFDRTRVPTIALTNGVITITGLEAIPVQFSNNTTLVPSGTNTSGLSLKLLPNGLIRGNFMSPVTSKNTLLKGAVLQNMNEGYGFYLGSGTSGSFELGEQPVP